ncbi:Ribonucleases P/MRP protein subunit pop1 [Entomophthora muscae]|uniref:Ribonucleases P/MRP protein subunit pop1 n=1 Tax=Entomophthora muscae TaxID=34485 RepID=A0ACC2SFK8_9FUNG|nr:Ribonucleases P/MRP protein subunit pop1 [Entomophthora muscae]
MSCNPASSGRACRKNKVSEARKIRVFSKGARMLSVQNFFEARKLEILSMKAAIKSSRYASSKRVFQTLPRHLRRRTASFNSMRVPMRLRRSASLELESLNTKAKRKNRVFKMFAANRKAEYLRRQKDKRWLETHIWHAKRFHMETIWGYRLGISTTYKNFRASYRSRKTATSICDVSYTAVIELCGYSSQISLLLKSYLDLSQIPISSKRYISGRRICNTFFYQRNQYPLGLICPVQILWSPNNVTTQKLWIFAHPSCYETIFKLLQEDKSSAELQFNDLRGKLNIFQLSGATVLRTLGQAFRACDAEDSKLGSSQESQKSWPLLLSARDSSSFPPSSVLGLTVHDPRLRLVASGHNNYQLSNSESEALHSLLVAWPSALAQSTLWDSQAREALALGRISIAGINNRRSQLLIPGSALEPTPNDSRIPVLLVRCATVDHVSCSSRPTTTGWNLIVPGGFGMDFWKALVFAGAREEGLRDWNEKHFEASCPSFPNDFPATPAYDETSQRKASALEVAHNRRPPAKRVPYKTYGVEHPFRPPFPSATDAWLLLGAKNITWLKEHLRHTDLQTRLITHFRQLAELRGLPIDSTPDYETGMVLTKLLPINRGSILTNATIYSIDQTTFSNIDLTNKSVINLPRPSRHHILGYVTTGHYSLTLGKSAALATCFLPALARAFQLDTQNSRSPAALVLVFPINSSTPRLAQLDLV